MSGRGKDMTMTIAGIVVIGLIGLALTMFVLLRDDSPAPESTNSEVEVDATPVDAADLEPITVSTSDREVRWMFIDPERGLRAARSPLDIPRNVRSSVVVWKSDFPPEDVYYVVDLSDADLQNSDVSAHPLSPEDFESRSREVVTALWLAYDVTYLAEDLALDTAAEDIRGKSKKPRKRSRRKTVIDRMNKYPTFRIPGR